MHLEIVNGGLEKVGVLRNTHEKKGIEGASREDVLPGFDPEVDTGLTIEWAGRKPLASVHRGWAP